MSLRFLLFGTVAAGLSLVCGPSSVRAQPASSRGAPDFSREVRPILSQYCFKCHGPDEGSREAGVRLDIPEASHGRAESGERIITPSQPDASELIRRIETTDADLVMPPTSTHVTLTAAQKETLRRWVAAGAGYAQHWAFVAPERRAPPVVRETDWPRNSLDHFVLAALEQRDLAPSPEADRYALIRRVSLDLLGLPPTLQDTDSFVNDPAPDAYERLVDRLLSSPSYGERWARKWLDLARYADTNGYEKDRPRTMWLYRDWVIRALNEDLPFDRFTVEQLAGDMLPAATLDQRIATGFHRNTMLNEEGGIDPLEYRFHALTDRVATTGAIWLGLTVGCAQCHTHKYDPITHTDYYALLGMLNNADEPSLEVPTPSWTAQRVRIEADVAARTAELPSQFPAKDAWAWEVPRIVEASSAQGASLTIDNDQVVAVTGTNPDTDTYTLTVETNQSEISAIQIRALTDASLGQEGPGRTPHGNFVVTEVRVDQQTADGGTSPVKFQAAMADFSQDQFGAKLAIDEQPQTGWAIQGSGRWNVPRTLTVRFAERTRREGPSRWTIRLEQWYGQQHTLGKFQIRLGHLTDTRPQRVRRQAHFDERFADWLKQRETQAVAWNVVRPNSWSTTLPRLRQLDDGSLLASGDLSKRDVYELKFGSELNGATAVRIEVLPHESLPRRGPGAVYYEGPRGDFFLSELQCSTGSEEPVAWNGAIASYANGKHNAAAAIDGDPLTGWSVDGGQGEPHVAVFRFDHPLAAADEHILRLIFERYYAAGMGRFRVSATTAKHVAVETAVAPDIETLMLLPREARTPEQHAVLVQEFCRVAPELAQERAAIDHLRDQLPEATTALVFQPRPGDHQRTMHRYHRGEFLQPREEVTPGVPGFLHPLDANAAPDRLALAEWLIDARNPMVARVTVNRHWATLFGRGLVRTVEDFGYQGDLPTHPELLDWLATEFVRRDWSIKDLHRLIVTSATYRQSSRVTPELLQRDPQNLWLARGPRVRLDAETVRDQALAVSGLLSDKLCGPSVFPQQPGNVTTEGAYGKLAWNVSPGEDRYRRGLYTFAKRSAPYAMFNTFDAPSGEACVVRRDVSNTPLQALTLLNDAVLIEVAQVMGRRAAESEGTDDAHISRLFRQCLTRPPTAGELQLLTDFLSQQRARIQSGELDPAVLSGDTGERAAEVAAWVAVARALLNLDEMITKE